MIYLLGKEEQLGFMPQLIDSAGFPWKAPTLSQTVVMSVS